jgi:prepilin-type N-terminal cleavage/methylation domain-containing protein
MNRTSSRQPRGFSLPELLVSLSLLMIFMGLAGPLFRSVFLSTSMAATMSDRSTQIDTAVDAIRRDVWGSQKISVEDRQHAKLTADDGRIITWTLSSDGTLSRDDGGVKQWQLGAAQFTFTSDSVSLTLTEARTPQPTGVRFPSQLLLGRSTQ